MYFAGDIPDEQPDLTTLDLAAMDNDKFRGVVIAWAAWWWVDCDPKTQTLANLRASMRAVFGNAGRDIPRMSLYRWSDKALSVLRGLPSTAKDILSMRNAMVEQQSAIGSKAARLALKTMPTLREFDRFGDADNDALSKQAASYAKIATSSHTIISDLLHMGKLPPEVDLGPGQVVEVMAMLPRAFATFRDDQLDDVIAMAMTAKSGGDDSADLVGALGI